MGVLSNLKPERVFYYFEEISKIPRGSFNMKQISDYLVNFAKVQGLEWRQDTSNNVIIKKPAAAGYEKAPTVILQGHCDMVCEKSADSDHDFEKEGLKLLIEGDNITAKDTTLGADNGIAVAYAMAILEDRKLLHPAIEVVITTDEEVGLLGASALDVSDLKGEYLINIDTEEEGKLWVSCAGGLTVTCELPVTYVEETGTAFEIVIEGLTGGHSGTEIDKIRANANKLMGQLLFEIKQKTRYSLVEFAGGLKDNAIPRSARALLLADLEAKAEIEEAAAKFEQHKRKEYSGTDTGITVKITEKGQRTTAALHFVSLEKVLFLVMNIPDGVQKMSGEIEGLVETSENLGILKLGEESCLITSSIRSSVGSAKVALQEKVQYLVQFLGGTCTVGGDYPAWEYQKNSRLREIMERTYEEVFGEKSEVQALHAGLECGLFYEKIPNLDCVSFGPNMQDVHTTEERLSISSTERTWQYLLKVLENIK